MPTSVGAQEVTATISGTVTDPSGAVVSNADIAAKDLDRGTSFTTKTNGQGFYNLSQLPVGRYELRVTAPGFRTAVQPLGELTLNQVVGVNVQLVVGQTDQTVTVTGEAPMLQTQTTEVSTIIDAATNVALPLASRNYLQLTLVTPGVVTPSPSGFTNGKNSGETARPEINGNRFTANNYLLDGMDNNQASDNFVGYSPQPDAIQEFNVITQNAPADFGNYQGGIISASIKSGTNQYHGTAFTFFRNDVLNANEWSNKLQYPYIPRPKLRWNQFGGTIGGPIVKNKLFFFADYEGLRYDIPSSGSNFTVFTTQQRQGDVSQLVARGYKIVDPLTGQPFPNNVIPANRLSPAAMAIVNSQYYPKPINGNLSQNAINTRASQTNNNQGDGKIDWTPTTKDRVMGRFSMSYMPLPILNSYDLGYNNFGSVEAWNVVSGWTHTFTPNILNDARFGVNYVNIGQNHVTANFPGDAETLFKIPGLPTSYLPAIQFTALHQVTGMGGSNTVFGTKASINDYADTVIQYQDVLSWTHGKHNTRFGFQGWRLRMNGIFPGNSGNAGQFQFNGQYSGSAESDFLLGLPAQIGVGLPGPVWGQRGNIFAGFVQDDWRLTPKLTLNLGLRYEIHTAWYEAQDKQVNWDAWTGQLELPGVNGMNRALYNTYNGIYNWQPRLGFAYQLYPNTVIRAGFSMSTFMEGTGQGLRLPENPPASKDTAVDYRALPYPRSTLDQGFGAATLPNQCTLAGLATASPLCYNGAVLRVWDHHIQPAASSQWNLFVEQQVTPNTTFSIGYVGQTARHLTTAENLSQLQLLPNGTTAPSPYFAGNQPVVSQGVLLLATYTPSNQNYNALQVSLQGRDWHGLSYMLNYTWSHCLTNSVGFFGEAGQSASQSAWWQNQYDPHADYGSCYFDVKNVFTGYVVYYLPFGHGQAYANNLNKVANAFVDGWRVTAIPTFRNGFPLTLSAANDESGTGTFAPRPNCIAPPNVVNRPATQTLGIQWFDPSSYAEPSAGTFGNCPVSSVRGPGMANIDLGVAKMFKVAESQSIEFRAEFLNAFNHPIFDAPNNTIGSNMGVISKSEGARNIQFALKYNF